MADEKPKKTNDDVFQKFLFGILGMYLLWVIIQRIGQMLLNSGAGSYSDIWETTLNVFYKNIWPFMEVVGLIIAILSIWGIIYVLRKMKEIRMEENHLYGIGEGAVSAVAVEEGPGVLKNEKWTQVQTHINSKNPAEWRLAIIEADVMLDELLKASGYHGETVGERLKAVEPGEFLTLESAWEAHKVRNQIAHQGSGFEITEREARRVINLFESVFREFKII